MSSHLIIVDKSSSFKFDRTDLEVLTTKDYIARPELVRTRNPKIVNLSRAYSYLGAGYYCSRWPKRGPTRSSRRSRRSSTSARRASTATRWRNWRSY